jgi:hypothetical protein
MRNHIIKKIMETAGAEPQADEEEPISLDVSMGLQAWIEAFISSSSLKLADYDNEGRKNLAIQAYLNAKNKGNKK